MSEGDGCLSCLGFVTAHFVSLFKACFGIDPQKEAGFELVNLNLKRYLSLSN